MRLIHKSIVLILIYTLLGWCIPVYAYKVKSVSNGGTITGKVVFKGRVPKRTIIPTRDKSVCGGMRKEPKILVGKTRGYRKVLFIFKK